MCSVQELLDLSSSRAVILQLLQGLHYYLNCSELITSPQRIVHLVKCAPWRIPQVLLAAAVSTRLGLGEEWLPVGADEHCCAWLVSSINTSSPSHMEGRHYSLPAEWAALSLWPWPDSKWWAEVVRSTFPLGNLLARKDALSLPL